ncbi:MAG: B12-binding domain-containing radical SAM protein [Planctomycetota bacterium]
MKRILFVSAVDPTVEIETRYRPLWPGYLAAYTEKVLGPGRLEFRLCGDSLEREIESFRPDVVAISSVSQNFRRAEDCARTARERGLPVLVGGIHISMLPETLSPHMDIACIGEGEETFAELMSILLEDGGWDPDRLSGVKGITFRRGDGMEVTEPRPLIGSLDDIPHPDRALAGYARHSYMFTSRGCPYRCAFCASSRFWSKVRFASADYVVEEIEDLVRNGSRMISFYDDLFVADTQRLSEIADRIVSLGISERVKFTCSCRANLVSEPMVEDLRRMGVVSVGMGLESGNDRILSYLKGAVSVAENTRAVHLLKDAGIQANASFVIGSPDETESEIMDTYNFIKNSRLDFTDVYVLTPLPGTPVWEYALERGLVSNDMDWSRLDVNFASSGKRAAILSEKLERRRIASLYRKFRRQRFFRILRSLPRSPWLRDVPKVAWRVIAGRASRAVARLFGGKKNT